MKKNVILITVDTLRRDRVAQYNPDRHFTPFIDSISNNVTVFEKMFSTAPYTQASFPAILTSTYYLDHGRNRYLSPEKTLISEILKANGVITAAFHSNAYLGEFFGWKRGWDHFFDSMTEKVTEKFPYIKGNEINKKISEWLKNEPRIKNNPMFMWVHYMDVHEPYIPDKGYLEKVDPSMDLTEDQMFSLFKEVLLPRNVSDHEKIEVLKKLDAALILEVDEYICGLFRILEKSGHMKNSTVIITADHGDEFGEHGSLSHDGKMYSELIHIPFLIYDPELQAQQRVTSLASTIDISPTLLHMFSLENNGNFKGQPLIPLQNFNVKGIFGEAIGKVGHQEKKTDKPVYYYLENDMKIILTPDNRFELYDLKEDPYEKYDIFTESSESKNMKIKLLQKIKSH